MASRKPRTRQAIAAKAQAAIDPASRLLRLPDVVARVGVCDQTIRNWERKGQFPTRRRLGPGAVGWTEAEFQAWLASRPTGFNARKSDFGTRP